MTPSKIARIEDQERFFRKGTKGRWKTDPLHPLAQPIAADHAKSMRLPK